jgi:GT2 family glycosyltransferase
MDLSIVIVEYNSLHDLGRCLDSIKRNIQKISYETIVVSNSCYGKSRQEELRRKRPDAVWIFSEKNAGFAGGMNEGIRNSRGNCVCLMNTDVRLLGDVSNAYSYLMKNHNAGMIGPKIIDRGGNLQDSCRKFMTPKELFTRTAKRVFLGKDVLLDADFDYGKIQPVDWVIGAFLMAKREAIERTGLLDEKYFLYVEDMDWCRKFWDCGFRVIYYPELAVEYKGDRKSISPLISQGLINKYSLYHLKSYLRFIRKHGLKIRGKPPT